MPKVSKLVSLKLEKHFNDTRAEKNFFNSGETKLKSESPVNQMAKIKQEYFESLIDIEQEKKKYYLKKYNAAVRENQRKFLEEVEDFLTGDGKSKTSSNKGTAREDVDVIDTASKADDKTAPVSSDVENEDENCLALNLDSKSEAGKSAVSKKTRMTILSSARSRSRLLPEISVPICEGGKIKPKLKDSPKRKTTFLEAERVVKDANDVYAQAKMQEINDIYKYRVRDHSLKAPTREEFKHKRDPARRFRLHLHAGTILKAPKLCADVEKILSMNEKRTFDCEQTQEHDDEKIFVSEKGSMNLLPKGDGVLKHLPVLLGVDMESLAEENPDEKDGDKDSAEVVIELEGADHEHTKLEESEEEADSAQSSEEVTEERWDADVDGATISSADVKPAIKHRKLVSKKERDEKHTVRRLSESSSSDEETVTETNTAETKSVTPLAFKRVESSSSEISKQNATSTLADGASVSHAADNKQSDSDAINQVEQVQGYTDRPNTGNEAGSDIIGKEELFGNIVTQLREDETQDNTAPEQSQAEKEAVLEDSASESEATIKKDDGTIVVEKAPKVEEDNTDSFFDDPVVAKSNTESQVKNKTEAVSSTTDEQSLQMTPEAVNVNPAQEVEDDATQHAVNEEQTQLFQPETESGPTEDNKELKSAVENTGSAVNEVESDDQRKTSQKTSNDDPSQVEVKDFSESQNVIAEKERPEDENVEMHLATTGQPAVLQHDESTLEVVHSEDQDTNEKVSSQHGINSAYSDEASRRMQLEQTNVITENGSRAAVEVTADDKVESNNTSKHEPTEEAVAILNNETDGSIVNGTDAVHLETDYSHPLDVSLKSESELLTPNGDYKVGADSSEGIGEVLPEAARQDVSGNEHAFTECNSELIQETQSKQEVDDDEKTGYVSTNDQPLADGRNRLESSPEDPNNIEKPIQESTQDIETVAALACPPSEIAVGGEKDGNSDAAAELLPETVEADSPRRKDETIVEVPSV